MARKSTGSNRQHVIALAAMLGLLVGGIAKTEAADYKYKFTKIADTTGPFSCFGALNSSGVCLSSGTIPPAVNDRGVVAFTATLDSGLEGLFTGEGTGTTPTIADAKFSNFRIPSFNNDGTVAVRVFDRTATWHTIVRSDGTTITPIAQATYGLTFRGFRSLGNPSVNDDGAVAFWGFDETDTGIFRSDGSTTTVIAHAPNPFTSFGDNPSLGDQGAVAFLASDVAGWGIFRWDGTGMTPTVIAHTSGQYSSFGLFPSLNNKGEVAFFASLYAGGGSGIFVSNGPTTTTIADSSSSPFLAFGSSPSINDKGVVAFWASLDAGGHGIFTGPDPVAHKVIAAGDALDGSTVTFLTFGREGLNNASAVAFVALLADGTRAVYRADPVPSEPEVLKVSVDVKPGGNPNSINPKSQGTVPVAILGTADFDATTVNPRTVTLAGARVKLKKNGTPMAAYEDANGDGRVDLVVHVSTQDLVRTQDLQLGESSMVVVLTGQTYDGMAITGSDTVRIVP